MSYRFKQKILIVYAQEIPGMTGTYNFTRVLTMVYDILTHTLLEFFHLTYVNIIH